MSNNPSEEPSMTPSQPDTDESPDALARVLDNLTDLKNYIGQRESHLVELKKGAPRTPAGKSAAAMASNEARSVGLIVLGVKEGPPHSFPGLELSDEFARKLRNDITSKVSPPPSVQIWTIHTGDNRSLMCIAVQGDGHRIYEYEGQPYKRIGTENVKLTRSDALEQQVSRSRDRNSWETQTRSGTTELLDPRHVSRFLDAVRDRQSTGRSDQEILSHYGFVSEVGLVSNAAVALFRGSRTCGSADATAGRRR